MGYCYDRSISSLISVSLALQLAAIPILLLVVSGLQSNQIWQDTPAGRLTFQPAGVSSACQEGSMTERLGRAPCPRGRSKIEVV